MKAIKARLCALIAAALFLTACATSAQSAGRATDNGEFNQAAIGGDALRGHLAQ